MEVGVEQKLLLCEKTDAAEEEESDDMAVVVEMECKLFELDGCGI